jgi:WD40 repeat protein
VTWVTKSGAVQVLDVRGGNVRRLATVPGRGVRLRADGANVVVAAGDGAHVLSWSGGVDAAVHGHSAAVTELFMASAGQFVTVSRDGTAKAWTSRGDLVRTFTTPGGDLIVGAIDEVHDRLAVGGAERRVYVFRLSTGELLRTLDRPPGASQFLDGTPTCLSFDTTHGRLWAAALNGHNVGAWDLRDFAFHEVGGLGLGSTGWAVTDPRGRWLFAAEQAVGACAWFDANDFTRLPWNPEWEPGTRISRVHFSPSGEWLLVASLDGSVRVFAMNELAPWAVFTAGNSAVVDACWSPDGRSIAAGHEDGSVLVWPLDPLPVARAHLVRREGR